MLKNATIYRIAQGWAPSLGDIEAALDAARFVPCGPTQDKAVGWVAPRGEAHGALVEAVAGQHILRLQIETKSVPGALVRRKAQEAADHIEATTGRKPGKKEMKNLREDALLALLPQAFPRTHTVLVWIDQKAGLLITDASSQGKQDDVITALVRAFDGFALSLLNTNRTPVSAMAAWLSATDDDDWPEGFSVDRNCVLISSDEERATVKFDRHHIFNDEVRRHIAEGKLPKQLAITWQGRVSFILTESMSLRRIAFLEGVFEGRSKDAVDNFDSNVAIYTGELSRLVSDLVSALGGELLPGQTPGVNP